MAGPPKRTSTEVGDDFHPEPTKSVRVGLFFLRGGDGGSGGMGGMGGMPDLCMDVDCSDGDECTEDVSDPADGSCSNPNEGDGTTCDAAGLPGECAAGSCVAVCTPTPDVMANLPALVPNAVLGPTYTDMTNGFTIRAVNCDTPLRCEITSTFRGLGSNGWGAGLAFDPSDSFLVEFFDQDGNARTASNVAIVLNPQGTSGFADVRIDGGVAVSVPLITGQANIVSVTSAHEIEVISTMGFVFWQQLDYDHDCL